MLIAGVSDFLVEDLTDWIVDVIKEIGYLGVALLVALESVFPPIPSEVVLPAAGLASSRGEANVVVMVVAATIGSVLGAWALYLIAAAIGEVRLHALVRMIAPIGPPTGGGSAVKPTGRSTRGPSPGSTTHSNSAVLICRCTPPDPVARVHPGRVPAHEPGGVHALHRQSGAPHLERRC